MADAPPPKRARTGEKDAQDPSKTVFVGGLPNKATQSVLKEVFSKFGDVVSVKVVMDSQTKQSKGFGFVTFSSAQVATELKATKKVDVLDRKCDIGEPSGSSGRSAENQSTVPNKQEMAVLDRARKQAAQQAPPERRCFVGGLPKQADEASAWSFFSQFGVVQDFTIVQDTKSKASKGFGFVTFNDPQTASFVKSFGTVEFMGRTLNVGEVHRGQKPQGASDATAPNFAGMPGMSMPMQAQGMGMGGNMGGWGQGMPGGMGAGMAQMSGTGSGMAGNMGAPMGSMPAQMNSGYTGMGNVGAGMGGGMGSGLGGSMGGGMGQMGMASNTMMPPAPGMGGYSMPEQQVPMANPYSQQAQQMQAGMGTTASTAWKQDSWSNDGWKANSWKATDSWKPDDTWKQQEPWKQADTWKPEPWKMPEMPWNAGMPAGGGAVSKPAAAAVQLSITSTMKVSGSCAGAIIGKGGANLKQMQAQCGASITVSKKEQATGDERTVEIVGTTSQVQAATELVMQYIAMQGGPKPPDEKERTIFVGGMAPQMNEAVLMEFFSQFGMVESVKVIYDKDSGRSKGFGFVTFTDMGVATTLRGRGNVDFFGQKLDVGKVSK